MAQVAIVVVLAIATQLEIVRLVEVELAAIDLVAEIAVERPVEATLAQVIDLAVVGIAAVEAVQIVLGIAALGAVLQIPVFSKVPEAAAVVRVPAATEVLAAWSFRVGAIWVHVGAAEE